MIYLLILIPALILLYLFALAGRVGFADFKNFKNVRFAHRGLYGDGVPENSLWAFKRAVEYGFGAELDVHLLADGNLAVIHDSSLKRTAGVDVKIENLTLADLDKYRLEGTDEKIPTLKEVLAIFENRRPLIIELKADGDNVDRLCLATAMLLKNYRGKYCVESFDPMCVRWFKRHCPQVIRGQLSENYFKNKRSKLPLILKIALTFLITNLFTRPDFIAYRFEDRKNLSFKICTELYKLQGVAWTVKGNEISISEKENLIPIFEEKKTV